MMNKQPLVSVIIPTYNRKNLVVRAISSVLSQSYKFIEVVVVDDCSNDGTYDLLNQLSCENNRLIYSLNFKNKGCAGARSSGVDLASGEYIAFLDDDDVFLPEKISKQIDVFMRNPGIQVVCNGSPKDFIPKIASVTDWIALEFYPHMIFDGCNLMMKKSVFEKIIFRSNYMEWRDLAFQIYKNDLSVALTTYNDVKKNKVLNSLSTHKDKMYSNALNNAIEYYEFSLTRPNSEREIFKGYLLNCYKNVGNLHLKRFQPFQAFKAYAAAYRVENKITNLIPFI